jgi:hypothetical protein
LPNRRVYTANRNPGLPALLDKWSIDELLRYQVPSARWQPPKQRWRRSKELQELIDRWAA